MEGSPVRKEAKASTVRLNESQDVQTFQDDRVRLLEERVGKLIEEKAALDAIIQMRSYLQVNVAHDLRTPLAAIRGYTRMILDGRGGEVNDVQKEYLRIVTDNTNRLISTVSWMSNVAELSARHFKLSTFDLRRAWAECVDANRQSLRDKTLNLTEQIPDEEFVIIGDREKLTYALTELFAAAVRFSDPGGTIAVEFSNGREKQVTVKISEKSASIPTDALDTIFDPSFNRTGKPAAHNMDAGAVSLSGVYDVVGMHGGRVFVNSTSGQGATLMFTLPAVTSGGEEKSHEQAVNSSSR
jgi:signal transduction histidine kinase